MHGRRTALSQLPVGLSSHDFLSLAFLLPWSSWQLPKSLPLEITVTTRTAGCSTPSSTSCAGPSGTCLSWLSSNTSRWVSLERRRRILSPNRKEINTIKSYWYVSSTNRTFLQNLCSEVNSYWRVILFQSSNRTLTRMRASTKGPTTSTRTS